MLILNVFYLYITSFTKMYNRLGNYFYDFFIFVPSNTQEPLHVTLLLICFLYKGGGLFHNAYSGVTCIFGHHFAI